MQFLVMKDPERRYLMRVTRAKCRDFKAGKIKSTFINLNPLVKQPAAPGTVVTVKSKMFPDPVNIEIVRTTEHYFLVTVTIHGKHAIFNYYM